MAGKTLRCGREMNILKCLNCGWIGEDTRFIVEYGFGDELPIYECPQCGNSNEDKIVEEK